MRRSGGYECGQYACDKEVKEWRDSHQMLDRLRHMKDLRTFLAIREGARLGRERVGRSGLEQQFEEELRGRPGARVLEIDHRP